MLASLVTEDKVGTVCLGIEAAVAQSFIEDTHKGRVILVNGAGRITRDEIKRRGKLCLKIFVALRGDLKWTIERILDHLPQYLRKELDGESWEPEARRASWFGAARPGQ